MRSADRKILEQKVASAIEIHREGQGEKARELYLQVLEKDPDNPAALHYLALIKHQSGDTAGALPMMEQSLKLNPLSTDFLSNMGAVYNALGLLEKAAETFTLALQLRKDHPQTLNNLGQTCLRKGDYHKALEYLEKARSLLPYSAEINDNRGEALLGLRRFHEAVTAFSDAIACNPQYFNARCNLIVALIELNRPNEAAEAAAWLRAHFPDQPQSYSKLAGAFVALDQFDEALVAAEKSISLNPNLAEGQYLLGTILATLGRCEDAVSPLQKACAIAPTNPDYLWNRGLANLMLGNFKAGWADYEVRWQLSEFTSKSRSFAQPRWDGSSLTGKSILLHAEQGFGDTFQFARFVPVLVSQARDVYLELPKSTKLLFESSFPGIRCIVAGDTLPVTDFHSPLGSLPGLLQVSHSTLPNSTFPYLRPTTALLENWRNEIKSGEFRRIGLVWKGNPKPRNRSIPAQFLEVLSTVQNAQFYSLQVGVPADDFPKLPMIDLGLKLHSFSDTAAAILNLDLVITIDTAVAHLAGALGVQTWVLLPFFADWRWQSRRVDSPWYPRMRLFRQNARGDWKGVIETVVDTLGSFAAHR